MAAYFLDSSALVKRYVIESGSTRVSSLVGSAAGNQLYLAHLTVVEVSAAIARRVREGSLSAVAAQTLRGTFLRDVAAQFQLIALDKEVVNRAVGLTERHPLRAADAVQLATALNVNDDRVKHGVSSLTVICSDQSLLNAAAAEGLATEDPTAQVP